MRGIESGNVSTCRERRGFLRNYMHSLANLYGIPLEL